VIDQGYSAVAGRRNCGVVTRSAEIFGSVGGRAGGRLVGPVLPPPVLARGYTALLVRFSGSANALIEPALSSDFPVERLDERAAGGEELGVFSFGVVSPRSCS
jgi:hypothetical protein